MANTINASTVGLGSLISTADNSGILQLQTTGTTALTIDASQNVSFAKSINVPNTFGFKNRIINGDMRIDQRNNSATITPITGQYSVDRWRCYLTQASKYSIQKAGTTLVPGFSNALLVYSLSAYSVTATDYFLISQHIEGLNITDLAWGTANASPITLSFWAYSSLTGTFGGSLTNKPANRSYPFTYTINSTNTWEYKTVTIPGDTTGTWSIDNTIGMSLYFGLGAGTTYSGTAGSWSSGQYYSATGAVSLVGVNGAAFVITGVQLEKGSSATSFDVRDYGRELMLCQRYYEIITYPSNGSAYAILGGILGGAPNHWCVVYYKQNKRAIPTFAVVNGSWVGTTPIISISDDQCVFGMSTNSFYLSGTLGTVAASFSSEL